MATEQVLIGCKLPHGLIMEIPEVGDLLRPKPVGKRAIIKGANSLRTNPNAAQGVFPYAVTSVDKDLWDAWLARYKNEPYVKNGLVFVAKTEKDAQAMSKERAGERTGMEALSLEVDGKGRSVDPRLARTGGGAAHTVAGPDPDSLTRLQNQATA